MPSKERLTVIDIPGLSLQGADEAYVDALHLPSGKVLLTEDERVEMLARLRESAGVTVVTGPFGAPFWSLASYEVGIKVVPDDFDYRTRITDDNLLLWSLLAVGLPETVAGRMAENYSESKPPAKRNRLYGKWEAADALRTRLLAAGTTGASVAPIIREGFPSEALLEPRQQLGYLDSLPDDKLFAFDYEWDIDTWEPHGLAVSDKRSNLYLPVLAADFEAPEGHGQALREAVKRNMLRGVQTIWHGGQADMHKQWPGDPIEAPPFHDTLVLASAAGEKVLSLKALGRSRLDREPMEYPKGHLGGLGTLPLAVGTRYAAAGDTRNTYDLFLDLLPDVRARKQWDHYLEYERPLPPILASMQKYGQAISGPELRRLRVQLRKEERSIVRRVKKTSGYDISDTSNKDEQTRAYIKSKTGFWPGSLSKEALSRIPDEWMDDIIRYRRVRHRRRSFVDKHIERWEAAGEPAGILRLL